MLSVNIRALTRLTYAAVPGFVERGHGTLINIASIVGIAPEILNGVYGASKAYVIAFSHSLEHELASKGIRVQAQCKIEIMKTLLTLFKTNDSLTPLVARLTLGLTRETNS